MEECIHGNLLVRSPYAGYEHGEQGQSHGYRALIIILDDSIINRGKNYQYVAEFEYFSSDKSKASILNFSTRSSHQRMCSGP
jgi:hypothetical protein